MDSQFSLLPKVINGGVAGVVGVTSVFPIDLCKTRIQKQQEVGSARLYRNIWDCFKKTYKAEGFRAMYKGLGVNALLITPEKSIKLVGNDFFRYHLKPADRPLGVLREMLAGGLAGMFQIVVTTPMEMLKIQMQDAGRVANLDKAATATTAAQNNSAQANALQHKTNTGSTQAQVHTATRFNNTASISPNVNRPMSATQIAIELLRQKGIRGLYQGYTATFLRDVSFSIVYFPLFARLNSLGKRRENSHEAVFYVSFISGLSAGCFAGWIVTPLDVVKTRLQTLHKAQTERTYSGVFDCFRSTLVQEGPRALFKGALARVLVIAPLFAIAQTVYYLGIGEQLCESLGMQRAKQRS